MDVFEFFEQFRLDLLPKDWVQELWLDDFILAETLQLPDEYEHHLSEIDMEDLLSYGGRFLKTWLSSSDELQSPLRTDLNDCGSKSWEVLVRNNIEHKPLLCLLSLFITQGKANIKNEKSRQLCLNAASLYFILLAIPGSSIYLIYNPILYLQAIDSIKLSSLLIVEMENVTAPKKQGRKNRKESDGDKCEKSGDVEDLMLDKRKTLIKTLDSILSDVIFMLERFQLKGQEESFIRTIQSLILITRIESKTISVVFNSVSYLAHKAFTALITLCSTNHGNLQEIVGLIMKELLPGLLMAEKLELQVTVSERNVIKGRSIQFIHNLLMSVKQPAHPGVKVFVQQLCLRTPNEAEGRAKQVETIIEVLSILPEQLYSEIVVWFLKLCHSDQVQHRITGLSIIECILICVNKNPSTRPSSLLRLSNSANYSLTEAVHFAKHKYLIAAVFSRCTDNSSTVRAKALSIMGNMILSKNIQIKQEFEGIFITPYLNDISVQNSKQSEKGLFDFKGFIAKERVNNIDPLPGARAFIDLLEKYVYDERVFVRKSAMQVLFNICLLNEKWMTDKLLKLMVVNCKDESLLVRKLMSKGLTNLLIEYPTNSEICHSWVQGIFPLLMDPETSSQEKVIELTQTAIIDNIVAYNKMQTPFHSLPWKLLTVILKLNMQKLFSLVCSKWNSNNSLKQSLITTIKSHIGTENSTTAWYLLASLANFLDFEEPFFILDFFYNNVHPELKVTEFVSQLVTEALYLNWIQLTISDQVELCQNLLSSLVHFKVPLHLIAPFINMCQLITEGRAVTTEQARERVKEWAGMIIKVAEKNLTRRIGSDCLVVNLDENYISQLIFTIGEATQICPNHLQSSTILMIKNLLETPEGDKDSSRWHRLVNSKVKSVSLVTLAKLCLQDEHTAEQLVPLFAEQLRKKESPKVKITVLIALTDLCVKYTNVTGSYISDTSLCLRDENDLVREKALSFLIELLQKDYLKMQSSLFFQLLILFNDDSTSIRNMLSSFIVNLMLVKHKGIIVKYFIESIFYYNEYNLIPLFFCVGVGCVGATFYLLRLATRNPEVTWNRKSNPEPWNEFTNKQYKKTILLREVELRTISNFKDMDQLCIRLYEENRSAKLDLLLKHHFNHPHVMQNDEQLDALVRGLATQSSQKMDLEHSEALTRYLYSDTGSYGMDGFSLDIQRGRDHGLAPYNTYRSFCGLPKARTFNELSDTIPESVIATLKTLYKKVDDIDLLVGGMAERPVDDSLLGPVFRCIIGEQFIRTRAGDRYFYDNGNQPGQFTAGQLAEIKKTSLSRVFCDNSNNILTMQPYVFYKPSTPSNELVSCSESNTILRINLNLWYEEPPRSILNS